MVLEQWRETVKDLEKDMAFEGDTKSYFLLFILSQLFKEDDLWESSEIAFGSCMIWQIRNDSCLLVKEIKMNGEWEACIGWEVADHWNEVQQPS